MPSLAERTNRSQHGTWIEIRLDRLRQNLSALRKKAGPRSALLAVVKANAYGHGLPAIAEALSEHVDFLGVSNIHEVLEIKEHGIGTPLFLFGRLLPSELPAVLIDGVTLSVSSLEEAVDISELSRSLNRKTPVHIKIDTGMGRLGIPYRQAFEVIQKIKSLEGIDAEGIYTHFPTAEKSDGFSEKQLMDFAMLLEQLEKRNLPFRYRHAANSAGLVKLSSPVFNLCRPGLMLYGIYPDPSLRESVSISPILSLKSRIIMIKQLQSGESVGYGRDFIANKPTTIATLPVGYSHGYPFRVAHQAFVLHQGKRCPVAGRVSMDYLCVDVSETHPQVGDTVTLMGEDGSASISSEEMASWAGTIPYEIVTRLASRLPRFYR